MNFVASTLRFPFVSRGSIRQKQDLPTPRTETTLCALLGKPNDAEKPAVNRFFMPVKIRMKRVGTKNTPVFRIVVADGRSPRDGKFIEQLGTYQPLKKGDNFTLNLERAKYWLSKGAQPSETVASFIKKASKAAPVAAQPQSEHAGIR